MPYIYKITNTVNGKVYIGKTLRSIEQRWREHCNEAFKRRNEKRPLYSAIRKYGIDAFSISTVEECEVDILSEREKFWIESFGSFHNGYNATTGGDGSQYVEYKPIVELYKELGSQVDVANMFNIDVGTVSKALDSFQIFKETSATVNEKKYGKPVNQYDLSGNFIGSFPSTHSAAKFLCKPKNGGGAHISDACKGKRKTAYGYVWKFSDTK